MRNIVLVGPMGSGKSAVARILADRLNRPLIDLDALAEEREGRTIAAMFERDGEAYFRDLESRLCREVAERDGVIVSTGGGVVTRLENLEALSRNGRLFCLRASVDTLLARVRNETHRPLLRGDDPRARLAELLARRKPMYDAIADQIETDGLSPEEVAARILQACAD